MLEHLYCYGDASHINIQKWTRTANRRDSSLPDIVWYTSVQASLISKYCKGKKRRTISSWWPSLLAQWSTSYPNHLASLQVMFDKEFHLHIEPKVFGLSKIKCTHSTHFMAECKHEWRQLHHLGIAWKNLGTNWDNLKTTMTWIQLWNNFRTTFRSIWDNFGTTLVSGTTLR